MDRVNTWLCISCGEVLGTILGGELNANGEVVKFRTKGPNLVVYCPKCGSQKTFYTSDPLVRAMYQLINTVSDVSARAMVEAAGEMLNRDLLRRE